ncbi:glutamine amidotransferase [Rhizobium sp. BK060]|uniref:glutamine amidotransferase n=1 Tax=Rhizobium sp. BK060 TaxID=2587096 RepID=UPI00161A5008|nr:glutamine amidotransferase [Rhizobium sp. BK060]MBB3394259.1 GMP synthase (glutamine-hydrolyzing) [Rhizobium sp. BK060]
MLKSAIAIRHVEFESLGTFEAVLASAGYRLHYHDVGTSDLSTLDPLVPDLLVILGGPIGVYDTDEYPFLAEELALISKRLARGLPTLGICLGAQLMAASLGAKVAPMGTKEIGFSSLDLTDAGLTSPLRHLVGVPVLHWHGDAFQIPSAGVGLATTSICPTQAFAIGSNVLGIQFHPEVDATAGIERWLIGHAAELSAAGVSPQALRADAERHGRRLRDASRAMFGEWLTGLT